jgi:hypothetical protein
MRLKNTALLLNASPLPKRFTTARPVNNGIVAAVFHSECGRFPENPVENLHAPLGDQALGTP